MKFTIHAIFFSFLYVLLFSGDHVARKILLSSLTSYGANAFLFLVAGSLFIVMAFYQKITLRPSSLQSVISMVINALWFSCMIIFLQIGLANSSAGLANALFCSYPLVTYFTSIIFLKEDTFTNVKICGFLCVFIGFFILVSSMTSGYRISFHILLATVLMGSQLCLVRHLTQQYGVIYTLSWQHTLSGIFCAFIAFFVGFFSHSPSLVSVSSLSFWSSFFYIAVMVNVVAYYIQGSLVKKYLASTVSSFILCRPILGFIIAALVLKEPLTLRLFVAAFIIGVGVFIIVNSHFIAPFFKRIFRLSVLQHPTYVRKGPIGK